MVVDIDETRRSNVVVEPGSRSEASVVTQDGRATGAW